MCVCVCTNGFLCKQAGENNIKLQTEKKKRNTHVRWHSDINSK